MVRHKRRNPIGVKYSRLIDIVLMIFMLGWSVLTALAAYKIKGMSPVWTTNSKLIIDLSVTSFLALAMVLILINVNGWLRGMQIRGRTTQIFLSAFFILRDLRPNIGMILFGTSLIFMIFDPDCRRSFRPGPTGIKKGWIWGGVMGILCSAIFLLVHSRISSMGIEGLHAASKAIVDDSVFRTSRFGVNVKFERNPEQDLYAVNQQQENYEASQVLESAKTFLSAKEWDKAIEQYQKVVKNDSVSAEAHLGLGKAFLQKGEFSKAIEQAQKAIDKNPNFAIAYAILGTAYGESGDLERGAMHLLSAIMFDPNLAEAHYYLGIIHCAKNEHAQAQTKYEKLTQLGSPLAADLSGYISQFCPSPSSSTPESVS